MANKVEIEVKATSTGLRGEIKAETEAAAAGQEIHVPVKPDIAQWSRMVRGFTAGGAAGPAMTIPAVVEPSVDEGKAGSEGRKAGDAAGRSFKDAFTRRTVDINPGGGRINFPIEGILPAIQALGDLTGVLGLVPALAAGAVTSFGVMVVGVSGIVDAVKAWTQAQESAQGRTATLAAQQLSASNSLISASNSVRNARRAVTDAEDNYRHSVESAKKAIADAARSEQDAEVSAGRAIESALAAVTAAETTLTRAKHDALQAEQALTDARQAANRALEDAPNRVKDAELAAKQAAIDLRDAQDKLFAGSLTVTGALQGLADAQDAAQDPTKDHAKALDDLVIAQKNYQTALSQQNNAPADVQALSLAVQKASQHVDETALAYQRAQEDADKLTTAGVDGASQVVSAQDRVAQANQSVQDAINRVGTANEDLIRAQVDGNQRVVDAKARVVAATNNLADVERSGDESIIKSKEQVDDALRSQQAAIAAVAAQAESSAGSLSAFQDKLHLLSPAGQELVTTFIGLHAQWQTLRNDVQQRLFVGVSTDVQKLATADLPVLTTGLGLVASSLNSVIHHMTDWATSKSTLKDFSIIFEGTAIAAVHLGNASTSVLDIFNDIAAVAMPILDDLTGGWESAAAKAADFIQHARDTGQLQVWIQEGVDTLKVLAEILGNVIVIVKDLMAAPNSYGGGFLTFFLQVSGIIRWLLDNFPILIPLLEAAFVVSRINAFVQVLGLAKVATLAWAAAQWLFNAAMDANPIGLVILAVAALAAAGYMIYRNWSTVQGFFANLWRGIVDWTKWGVNGVIQLMNGMIDGFNLAIRGLNVISPFRDVPYIPHIPHWLASGGIGSGMTIVGERGPELLNLPGGSQVTSAADTRMRLANQTTGDQKITLEFANGDGTQFTNMVIDLVRNGLRTKGIKVEGLTA